MHVRYINRSRSVAMAINQHKVPTLRYFSTIISYHITIDYHSAIYTELIYNIDAIT